MKLLQSPKADTYSIIVIPGVAQPAPDNWNCQHQEPWLRGVARETPTHPRVVVVDHGLTLKEFNSWQDLITKGEELLDSIERFRAGAEDYVRLGGSTHPEVKR